MELAAQRNPFGTALESVTRLLPTLLVFLAILVAGWLIAAIMRRVVVRLAHRVDLSGALARSGLTRMGQATYDPAAVLARAVYYAVLLITLTLAAGVFGPNPVSALLASLVAFLPKAAIALVLLGVTAAISRAVRELISGLLGGLSYARLMANLAGVFVLGLGIIAALNQLGVATTVTTPVLITVLATIGGILVVGVGGGLIRPMQRRWDRWLDVAEREGRNISHTVHYNAAPPAPPADRHEPSDFGGDDTPTQVFAAIPAEDYSTGR